MIPPQNIEAEKSILGAILSDTKSIFKIIDYLEPLDFHKIQHQRIYAYMLGNINSIDLLSIHETTKIPKAELVEITNSVATSSHIEKHAKIVKDTSIRRQIQKINNINEELIKQENTAEDLLAEVQNNILSIQLLKKQDDTASTIISEIEEVQKEYSEKYKEGKKYLGIPTGIEKIDECIDGLRPNHIWVAGGFTSVGKTQFVLNIVHNVIEQNIPVSIISLEMSRIDTVARIMGIRHNLSSMKILKGFNDKEIQENIREAKEFIKQAPLQVHTTYFDIEKIKLLIRQDFYKGTKIFVLDYVQNVMSQRGLREYELLTQSAIDLQSLARELGITIIIISQISNEAEKGQGAGAGFKGTGALEAVADLAIRLKREKSNENPDDEYVPIKINIAKNRHGFTGVIDNYCMWLKSGKFQKDLIHISSEIKERIKK